MIPSIAQPSAPQRKTFREAILENLEDPVSTFPMTQAVTIFPCGHVCNEDTVIKCLARDKLCPLDRKPIENYVPNYTVRSLASIATSQPMEDEKPKSKVQELQQGKELSEKESYIDLLHRLIKAPAIQGFPELKKILEEQAEKLMNQKSEELNQNEQESYRWTQKLLTEDQRVSAFVSSKLLPPIYLTRPPLASLPVVEKSPAKEK